MKRRLAQWRWRIAGLTVVLAVARIAVAVGFELFGPAEGAANNALSAVAAAWDALCLGLVVGRRGSIRAVRSDLQRTGSDGMIDGVRHGTGSSHFPQR